MIDIKQKQKKIAARGFDPPTSGLWAQRSSPELRCFRITMRLHPTHTHTHTHRDWHTHTHTHTHARTLRRDSLLPAASFACSSSRVRSFFFLPDDSVALFKSSQPPRQASGVTVGLGGGGKRGRVCFYGGFHWDTQHPHSWCALVAVLLVLLKAIPATTPNCDTQLFSPPSPGGRG
jgi:hypothetical protein